ncbi:putative ribonuclease H-like domain-containing protein [Tanacetum coccineum]|uniref:Ribonuclease H-like domain-containing protein n=1 Tax=Tanacetum coccineum TaxID=301880 RepID=A0ABQ5EZ82_9ASTR
MVLFTQIDKDEFLSSHSEIGIVRVSLKKGSTMQMLKLKLESEEENTMALELIKFVKKILAELESEDNEALASPKANELTIPEQTATGKGTSNPLMAGCKDLFILGLTDTSNTNEVVNTDHGVSTASTQVNAVNSINIDNLSDAVIYDIEEMDLRWQIAMLTMRAIRFLKNTRWKLIVNSNETIVFDKSKVECYNCHKRRHFARECRAPRNQDNKKQGKLKRIVSNETSTSYTLCAYVMVFGSTSLHRNFMPPTHDLSFTGLDEFVNKPIVENCKAMSSKEKPKVVRKNDDAPCIKEWVSDDEEEDVSQPKIEKKIVRPSIVDYNFHQKQFQNQRMVKPVWNNAQRVNHQNFVKKTHPCAKKNLVPRAVLMKSDLVSINTARQNISKTAVLVNTARQVNTAHSKTTVNVGRPMSYLSKTAHSTVKRPIHKNTSFKNSEYKQRFTWVFLLATKDETSGILKSFITGIENLLDYKVKVIRTPQQNGVAKRRNRTLIEAARTMLADSKFATTFWDKAVEHQLKYIQSNVCRYKKQVIKQGQLEKRPKPSNDYIFYHYELLIHIIPRSKKFRIIDDLNLQVIMERRLMKIQEKKVNVMIKRRKIMLTALTMLIAAGTNKKFGFTKVKTASTPIETQKPLLKDEDGEKVDVHMYRSMIGSLMYLTSSRPDIMFAVCAYARYQVNPKISHLHAMKRIFRYLKGQPKLGLWYPKDYPFDLVAYTDSDYAGASLDRKSTTGEAEYVAASSCCRQVLWIQNQLLDYGKAKKSVRLMMEKLFGMELELILFWSIIVAKTINGEEQLHALVDGKKIITESSVRRDIKLSDEEGGGPGCQETMEDTIAQTRFENVSKHSNDSLFARVAANKENDEVNVIEEVVKVTMFNVNVLNGKEVFVAGQNENVVEELVDTAQVSTAATTVTITTKEITLAQALEALKTSKPKVKGVVIQEPGKSTTTTTISSQQSQDKGKGIMIEEPMKPMKKKDQIMLDEEADLKLQAEFDEKERLINVDHQLAERLQAQDEELSNAEKATLFQQLLEKRRKHFAAKRAEEKRNKPPTKAQQKKIMYEEEVAINAIPLAVKSPRIIDYKIHKEGKKSYYQIVRADGKSKMYMIFSQMLKSFDREDLEDLYKLVKAKYGSTRPVESMDYLLWNDMKIMFEPHVEDAIWRNQQGYKVLEWKLYDSCGKLDDFEEEYQVYGRIVRIKSLLDVVGITPAHVCVTTAQLELVLLRDFKENMLSVYYY